MRCERAKRCEAGLSYDTLTPISFQSAAITTMQHGRLRWQPAVFVVQPSVVQQVVLSTS